DAHVVVHPRHNGTSLVRKPGSPATAPVPCVEGEACTVCFTRAPGDCVETTYRGAGPPRGRADLTPAFYRNACGVDSIPRSLRALCGQATRDVADLGARRNCFAEETAAECTTVMARARARKAKDDSLYAACKARGQTKFNREHGDKPAMQRALNCAYEKNGTGANRAGTVTWRKLLDGGCRPGTYAGRDGLDCCSDDLWAAALFAGECARFFPAKPEGSHGSP
ncbi:MAG TPA: hypothetical protein VFU23_14315, partial [Gemmatimonadales bacterium]|nr:hypothetical protein [Gemmatimonadales bacterium]